jgi:hypothetical protein
MNPAEELNSLRRLLSEPGNLGVARAAVLGLTVVYACHSNYANWNARAAAAGRRIEAARAAARDAENLELVRSHLKQLYPSLPPAKDKAKFLTDAILETLESEKLELDSFDPPSEVQEGALLYQTFKVDIASAPLERVLAWLARLEAAKPSLRVTRLELYKVGHRGSVRLSADVATAIPAEQALSRLAVSSGQGGAADAAAPTLPPGMGTGRNGGPPISVGKGLVKATMRMGAPGSAATGAPEQPALVGRGAPPPPPGGPGPDGGPPLGAAAHQ